MLKKVVRFYVIWSCSKDTQNALQSSQFSPSFVLSIDVLKYGVYCYSGRMRPTDQETPAIEKMVCHLQFPRGEGALFQAGPHGESWGPSGDWRSRKQMWIRALMWFLQGGMGEVEPCSGWGSWSVAQGVKIAGVWGCSF